MKLSIISFKDNALGCFTRPFYTDTALENVGVQVTREIIASSERSRYSHKVVYKIGEFEDTTGAITPCESELILDCDEVIARIEAK